jgi:hypothetical protein
MATTKAQQKAVSKYVKANYDRIEFKTPKGRKAEIKVYAKKHGESINGFIRRAIDETMKSMGTPIGVTDVILSSDTLKEAQNAAERTGENVLEFIARAVRTQAKRDQTTQRMGLDPVTGGRLEQNGEDGAWTLNIQSEQ